MLKAIQSGKAGTIISGDGKALSWRNVYRDSEDLLTASVLGRLAYLSEKCLKKIIDEAAPESTLPTHLGKLNKTEFWPRLIDVSNHNDTVEPDAIFSFSNATLLFEAKRDDKTGQYAQQWAREWCALNSPENFYTENYLHLIAVGGISQYDPHWLLENKAEANSQIAEIDATMPSLNMSSISWARLAKKVDKFLRKTDDLLNSDKIILSDIHEALALHGFKTLTWLTEIMKTDSNYCDIYDSTSNNFFYGKQENRIKSKELIIFENEAKEHPDIVMRLWN